MHLSRVSAVLFGLAFTLPSQVLIGQPQSRSHSTVTTGIAWTGDRKYRTVPAPTADATYSWRVARHRRFTALVGPSAGISLGFPTGDDCLPNGEGGCQISMPIMGYLGAQLGGLMQFKRAALALSTGPGLYFVQGRRGTRYVAGHSGQSTIVGDSSTQHLGVLTRAEIMQRITPRFALLLSGDLRMVNNVFGKRLVTHGASFGIRMQ